jgi:alpha-ketoglutarate-dependent taurine dioxygenase
VKKLPTLQRKRVAVQAAELVREEVLAAGQKLPLVLTPGTSAGEIDLKHWLRDHRTELERKLWQHGAVLFRGFGVRSTEQLQDFIRAASGEPLEYKDAATPRSRVDGNVYTSTSYPASETIELHNENCYAASFPAKLFFCCLQAAEEGGETPLADCRRVLEAIPVDVRRRFAEKGVLYVRNFVDGLGLSWRDAFDVEDEAGLAAFCQAAEIRVEWRKGGHLRTSQHRPALARHPGTGELVWFNQAVAFHVSTLPEEVRRRLLEDFGEDGVPKTTFFGDGSPIDEATLRALREAYRAATVMFPWHEGDVVMVDNLLTAHGRQPFRGPRKVIVGMSEAVQGFDVWIDGSQEA